MKHRMNLYNAVISPQFSYADIIWGGCGMRESQSLQRVQNFAAKSITGNRKYDSATKSLNQLKLLNLEQRRNVHETVFAHKALLKKSSANLNKDYERYTSKANTRQADKKILSIPIHKSTKYEKSPLYRTILSWNKCPKDLPFDNLTQHKNLFQKHLVKVNLNLN